MQYPDLPIEPILEHYGADSIREDRARQMIQCPFHDDQHASGSVNSDLGLFNCFACDMSGDAVAIVAKVEGVEPREALRIAQGVVDESDHSVSRRTNEGRSLLPQGKRTRPGRRGWKPPWVGH